MKSNVQLLLEQALPPLTREEEQHLFRELKRRQKHGIITTLVKANIPLVINVAQMQRCPGVSLEQFITEGLSTLLGCINTFDYKRGYRFKDYLYYSLINMFRRFRWMEQRRNVGRVNDEDEFFQCNYLTADPVNPCLYDLRTVIQENKANLTDMELFLIKHSHGIGENPKTMSQLESLIGGKLCGRRLRQIIAGAIEKLREVLVGNDNDNEMV